MLTCCQVHLDAVDAKGVIELMGKGGAIRVQRGDAQVNDSRFVGNTARYGVIV